MEYSFIVEKKNGKKWEETYRKIGSKEEIGARLAADLAAKYIGKAPYIKRIDRKNNYNGTQTYTVYETSGDADFRTIYTTETY